MFLCFFFYVRYNLVFFLFAKKYGRSDTESHGDVNKNEGKRKYVIQLNNLFKKRSDKPEALSPSDAEQGKVSNDEEDNAPPSESTVIVEDEPQKKVINFKSKPENYH